MVEPRARATLVHPARCEPTFRRRVARDTDDLFELFNEERFLRLASPHGPFASRQELHEWFERIIAARKFEVVAACQGKAIGLGGLYVLGDGLGHIGWVLLGVREAFQGRGIGSTLLELLITTADLFVGLQRVQLTVYCDNAAAIRLYQKFGFEIEGRHRLFARRSDGFVDAFTMARIFDRAEHQKRQSSAPPQQFQPGPIIARTNGAGLPA